MNDQKPTVGGGVGANTAQKMVTQAVSRVRRDVLAVETSREMEKGL